MLTESPWVASWRADPQVRPLADRHYNRQKVGAPQFVPPGRCLVLKTSALNAFWCTSWPYPEYVKHAWAGAWICSAFRNEGPILSSTLITAAVAHSCWYWDTIPDLGMVTFVNRSKVRHKRDPGRCYRKAGFFVDGETAGGLLALRLDPHSFPDPVPVTGMQMRLEGLADVGCD